MGIMLLIFIDKFVFCCLVDIMIFEYWDKLFKIGLYVCLILEWYILLIFFMWVLWKMVRIGILVLVWLMIGFVMMFLLYKNMFFKWYSVLIVNVKSLFLLLKKWMFCEVL